MNKIMQVQDFIKGLSPNTPDFSQDDNLQDSGILDSIGMMELVLWSESKFNFVIDTDHLTPENFSTVVAIVAYIEGMIAEKPLMAKAV